MKILMVYGYGEYTTARYYEDCLRRQKDIEVIRISEPKIIMAQVLNKITPDLIFVLEGHYPQEIMGLQDCKIPKIYLGIDTHRREEMLFRIASEFETVYFAQKPAVEKFNNKFGNKAIWLPLACEPLYHQELQLPCEYDIAFVGGTDLADVHLRRRELLKKLINAGLKVWVGRACGLWLSYIYSKSKIVFNNSVNDDVNMRVFEAMACKRLLLNDELSETSGMSELFEVKKHYIKYDDWNIEKNAIEKPDAEFNNSNIVEITKYYLEHDKERQEIALAGYNEVIKNNCYNHRVEVILEKWKSKQNQQNSLKS